jgi:RNase adapter protein RapZ
MSSPMRLVVISGLSGSGKSVALHMLEDLGYYCVDNIPAGLLNTFVSHTVRSHEGTYNRTAVGLDARNRPEDLAAVPGIVRELRKSGLPCEVLFLNTDDETLLRRYAETRRRHPLAQDGRSLREAIEEERRLLRPITDAADLVVDTTGTSVHQLREIMRQRVDQRREGYLSILFESFGFKDKLPGDVDFVFDARTLPNPYWDPALKHLTGKDTAVIQFLDAQPAVQELYEDIAAFIGRRIPTYIKANRRYLTVAVGCTGGQHRSVYLVEKLARHFAAEYTGVLARHASLESR